MIDTQPFSFYNVFFLCWHSENVNLIPIFELRLRGWGVDVLYIVFILCPFFWTRVDWVCPLYWTSNLLDSLICTAIQKSLTKLSGWTTCSLFLSLFLPLFHVKRIKNQNPFKVVFFVGKKCETEKTPNFGRGLSGSLGG